MSIPKSLSQAHTRLPKGAPQDELVKALESLLLVLLAQLADYERRITALENP